MPKPGRGSIDGAERGSPEFSLVVAVADRR